MYGVDPFVAPEDLVVAFPQTAGGPRDWLGFNPDWIQVEDYWRWEGDPGPNDPAWSSRSLAILTLDRKVASTYFKQVAPVFLGDVEAALQDGTLVADDAIVAGYGSDCQSCIDNQWVRRLGRLAAPVQVNKDWTIDHPFLESLFETAPEPGAEFSDTLLDIGGPLFLRESRSNRYVVVGTYYGKFSRPTLPPPPATPWLEYFGFAYLGRVGDGNPSWDHAEVIRQHLGEFTDGTPCEPTELLAGTNSNYEAEQDLDRRRGGMVYLADHCDPVPLMVFTDPARYKHKEATLAFSISPWLGNGAITPEFSNEGPINRFCECFNVEMEPLDESECLLRQCQAGDVNQGLGAWKGIDLYWRNENGGHGPAPASSIGHPHVRVREGRLEAKTTFEWAWTHDVPGHIRGTKKYGYPATQGFMGSTLASRGDKRSDRDDVWNQDLRGTVRYYRLEIPPPLPTLPPPERDLPCRSKRYKDCFSWINPNDFELDDRRAWPWWLPGIKSQVFAKDLLDQIVALQGDLTAVDISASLGGLLVELEYMKADGQEIRWLPALESIDSLARLGISERAAIVLPGGAVLSALATDQGLEAATVGGWGLTGRASVTSQSAATTLASLAASATTTLDLPANGRALYSAVEGVILVVSGPDGATPGAIRRTILASGQTQTLLFVGGQPSGTILGATYVPEAAALYVLDRDGGLARLTAYDVASMKARVIWTAPFTGDYDFVSLSHTATGDLLLTAGAANTYTAWLIREKKNGVVAFLGRLARDGMPLDEPVVGPYSPTLPVLDSKGEVRYHDLDPREFENGSPCESL